MRRSEQEAIERQRVEEAIVERRRQLDEGRRRSDALAACDILFHMHAEALGNRFSKDAYQAWISRHLTDGVPIDQFETRARELQQLILSQVPIEQPPPSEEGMDQVIAKYKARLALLEDSELEREWKETLIGELRTQFYNRLQKKVDEP